MLARCGVELQDRFLLESPEHKWLEAVCGGVQTGAVRYRHYD